MQGFQTHTAIQPISIQLLQTQQNHVLPKRGTMLQSIPCCLHILNAEHSKYWKYKPKSVWTEKNQP